MGIEQYVSDVHIALFALHRTATTVLLRSTTVTWDVWRSVGVELFEAFK